MHNESAAIRLHLQCTAPSMARCLYEAALDQFQIEIFPLESAPFQKIRACFISHRNFSCAENSAWVVCEVPVKVRARVINLKAVINTRQTKFWKLQEIN